MFGSLTSYEPFCWLVELGVLSWRLDADNYEADEELKKIREDRGYSYMVCQKNLCLLICWVCHTYIFMSSVKRSCKIRLFLTSLLSKNKDSQSTIC